MSITVSLVLNDGDGSKPWILPYDLGNERDEHAYFTSYFHVVLHHSSLFDLRGCQLHWGVIRETNCLVEGRDFPHHQPILIHFEHVAFMTGVIQP